MDCGATPGRLPAGCQHAIELRLMPTERGKSRNAFLDICWGSGGRRCTRRFCGQALQRFEKPLCEVRVKSRYEPDFGELG